MAEYFVLNHLTVSTLLSPTLNSVFTTEEQLHPWHTDHFQPFKMPFLRTWDRFSGSQPDTKNSMMARAPRQRPDTIEFRTTSLTTHLNHRVWTPTPYVSFTTNPAALQELANIRSHYNIQDPYGKSNHYYIDHHVCLWQVTEREIIGHWLWSDLAGHENWYEEIIMPAFRRFTRETVPMSPKDESFGLSAVMNKLSRRLLI